MRFQSILVCLAVAPLLMGASEPLRLQPVSKWVLDYGETSCRLIRTFGDPAKPTVLLFERASPTSDLSMVAIGETLKTAIRKEEVSARFLPATNLKFEGGRPAKSAAGKDPAVLWARVDFVPVIVLKGPPPEKLKEAKLAAERGERPAPIDVAKRAAARAERDAEAGKVTSIEITARRSHPVVLLTGSLGRPIKMLDECARNQLRGWGIDPVIEDKIVRSVWAPASRSWFTSDEYPIATLWRNEESVVEARLLVDAVGKVSKCTSLTHVDAPEFEKAVCDAYMKRAQFEPAELADGTKVPRYYVSVIRFVLPR